MQKTETQLIKRGNPQWDTLDNLCFLSKNLYNSALYEMRQSFFDKDSTLKTWNQVCNEFTQTNQVDFRALPTKVSQVVIRRLGKNFKSFWSLYSNPKYRPQAKLPNYLHKTKGRFVLEFNSQSFSLTNSFEGKYKTLYEYTACAKMLNLKFVSTKPHVKSIKVVKSGPSYKVCFVYEVLDLPVKHDNGKYAAIDLGINNFATLVGTNLKAPVIYNGKPLKSVNRYYNKKIAHYTSLLPKEVKTSNRIQRITQKRNNKINNYLHEYSTSIANLLASARINTLIVGYNKGWKQGVNLGAKVNQRFVSLPYYTFIEYLKYKCAERGIRVIIQEESYTSKCSFLDYEKPSKHNTYSGNRVYRGLFRTKDGYHVNADVNAAWNILAKTNVSCDRLKSRQLSWFVVDPVVVGISRLSKSQ